MTPSRFADRWLSTRTVEALGVREATLFRDRALAGFGVVVEPSGRKTYVMEVGAAGRRVALGRHGAVSAEAARRRAQALLAPAPEEAPPTVAEAAGRWLREHVEVRCKPATVAQYRMVVRRHVLPALGGVAVDALARRDVAALQHRLADRPAAANQAVAVLGRILAYQGGGLAEPCRALPRYRVRRRERFLTETEFRRLGAALARLEAAGRVAPHAAAAIRLLALTGCRRNEILRLRWEEVRLEAMELRLADSKTGPRTVPLSPAAAAILAGLARSPGSPFVMPGRRPGAPASGIFLAWRAVRRQAGLDDVRLHDLRHSFASRALALGESLPTIARLLGHARVQTTARYAHLARDAVKEAAARIAAEIGADILGPPARADPGADAGEAALLTASAARIATRIAAEIGAPACGRAGPPIDSPPPARRGGPGP